MANDWPPVSEAVLLLGFMCFLHENIGKVSGQSEKFVLYCTLD